MTHGEPKTTVSTSLQKIKSIKNQHNQGSEEYHGPALTEFVDWCNNSYLDLNVTKTKEMIVDFRRQEHSPGKTIIHNNEVEIVSKYKYLGTIFDDKLKWDDNTEEIVKKGQQWLYLL